VPMLPMNGRSRPSVPGIPSGSYSKIGCCRAFSGMSITSSASVANSCAPSLSSVSPTAFSWSKATVYPYSKPALSSSLDGGVACIDEIDKVNDDAVSSLHDALESQLVRINKAGINVTLNSCTALLGAGNPEHGRFNPYQPIAQQLNLGPTLMSRFDLMFMVSDSSDEEADREVIDHMMRSRRAAAKKELGENFTEEERKSIEPKISRETLRAYIAYAKEEVTPYLRETETEAREYLREEFLMLRLTNADEEDNPSAGDLPTGGSHRSPR